MTERRTIGDMELHAYVDGELEPAEQTEVEAWLATHPEDAERVAAWRQHKAALSRLSEHVLNEPVPPRLLRAAQGRVAPRARPWWQVAAAVVLLSAGVASGWLARGAISAGDEVAAGDRFVQHAIGAHAVYAPERRHPVEVWADKEEQHLVQWLSRRLGASVRPPPLAEAGFRLVGGRLVAEDGGPAAQYMYEDGKNRRITLYVRRAKDGGPTAFRFVEDRKLAAFYWIDGPLAYALIGEMPREELLSLARAVHRGLVGG